MNLLEVSHYRILGKLGDGATATVYLAEDTVLRRKVALKLLQRQLQTPEQLQRFQHEAQWASMLNHPSVLTIYEIGEAQGAYFIAMEFVDGQTLRHHINRGKLAVLEALDVAIGVAGALAAAHEVWIVHRDLKPENIMIRHDGYVKVLDFGVAKLTQQAGGRSAALTRPGMVLGTLQYISPEQARGNAVDPRTDLFSFGIVLYEMITGNPPFAGPSFKDLLTAVLEKTPVPLRASAADATPELEAIVMKALQKNPDDRYQTANEFLRDLKRARENVQFRNWKSEGRN